MRKFLFLTMMAFMLSFYSFGQESRVFTQKVPITDWDNYNFSFFYYSNPDKAIYNINSYRMSVRWPITEYKTTINAFSINPAITSAAYIVNDKKGDYVKVIALFESNRTLATYKAKDYPTPTALAYSPDGQTLAIANADKGVSFFELKKYKAIQSANIGIVAEKIAYSPNRYFIVASQGNKVVVWNNIDNQLRTEITVDNAVSAFAFSPDARQLAIASKDGSIAFYDTQTFAFLRRINGFGDASALSYHKDGKYLLVRTSASRICVANLMDEKDKQYLDINAGNSSKANFIYTNSGDDMIVYSTEDSFIFEYFKGIAPNLTQLLTDQVDMRMNDWLKMQDGESMSDYSLRVNEESRMEQMRLFEQEIATEMAGDILMNAEMTLGEYNMESNILALDFDVMPSIYLTVPSEDVYSFQNTENIEFLNPVYGLTLDDKFELIYADVYNKETAKTYQFNNLQRKSLEYLRSDDSFVPIELIFQTNMEGQMLEELKEKVVEEAKNENVITDKTQISVNSQVLSDVDASGKKILNYEIGFKYQVEKEFSAIEDFSPGKYNVSESGAAKSMIATIQKVFETEFAKYIAEGKRLQIKITGMADGLAISGVIKYLGEYGDFEIEPIYQNNSLTNISVTKKSGITKNEQLAFLRAISVQDALKEAIPALNTMRTEYITNIELAEGKGGEFRRISVVFTFIDAF